MCYEIDKNLWHTCKICGLKIQDLAKKYGGGNVYYVQVFKKHLEIDHDLTTDGYFGQYLEKPKCKCGVCQKDSRIVVKSSNFKWKDYICGRNEGQKKWSIEAKETRKGQGNPMYGGEPWNKGLSKDNNESILRISEKRTGWKTPDDVKEKQSIAAKKRKIHGHTGCKHSAKTKELFRQITLERIKRGDFKQTKTKPHLAFEKILKEIEIKYEEEKIVDCWSFDFYLIDYNVYVEVDGDYYHSNPKIYPNGPKTKTQKINWYRDIKKNRFCEKNSLTILRFWECDILNNPEEITCKLKKLLGLNI
jgi:very-short-patch-repair endonuclease